MRTYRPHAHHSQHGNAFLIFLLLMVSGALAFLLSQLDVNKLSIKRQQANADRLAEAKAALITYALALDNGNRPGDLPPPDVSFDGDGDSGCLSAASGTGLPTIQPSSANRANMRCLGRLPWHTLNMARFNDNARDPLGEEIWYAISANLNDPICLPFLNPAIANMPVIAANCGISGTLPYPWLTVVDGSGNVLSNRVAAVLILPGPAIGGQTRPANPATLNRTVVSNYLEGQNAALTNTFVQAPPNLTVPYFNDRLIFITIDELIDTISRRAAAEARRSLTDFFAIAPQHFPWAAPLGYRQTVSGLPVSNQNSLRQGFLPMPACRVTPQMGYDCTFGGSSSLSFVTDYPGTLASQVFQTAGGACNLFNTARPNDTCTCTGAGFCRRTSGVTRWFSCTQEGTCNSTIGIKGRFEFTLGGAATVQFSSFVGTPDCSLQSSNKVFRCDLPSSPSTALARQAIINDAGVTGNAVLTTLPDWFHENGWRNYLYYALAANCDPAQTNCGGTAPTGWLTVGNLTNVRALLINTGATLPTAPAVPCFAGPHGQAGSTATPFGNRPSSNVCDYLDSVQNTNLDTSFDPGSTAASPIYNDRTTIVAP